MQSRIFIVDYMLSGSACMYVCMCVCHVSALHVIFFSILMHEKAISF